MIDSRTRDFFLILPLGSKEKDLLTMRVKDILGLISKGLISREEADLLNISVNTHRKRIIERLHGSSMREANRYAIDSGILPVTYG